MTRQSLRNRPGEAEPPVLEAARAEAGVGRRHPGQGGEARERLLADGFVILQRVIDAEAIASLRAVARDGGRSVTRDRPHSSMVPLSYRDERVVRAITSPGLLAAFDDLGFRDIRWLSGYVVAKKPQAPGLWWHQDWWAWGDPVSNRRIPPQLFANVYLGDTFPANGCLRVLPGSHRRRLPLHDVLPEAHSDDMERLSDDHPAFARQPGEVDVAMKVGDVVLGDVRLLHATHPNTSDQARTGVILWFLPHYGELPERFRAHYAQHPCQPPVGWAQQPDSDVPARLRPLLPDHASLDAPPVVFNRHPGRAAS
jgi:hypothetical protein